MTSSENDFFSNEIDCVRICILICTYKRNRELFKLVHQLHNLRNNYFGRNNYSIWIADSDPENLDLININGLYDQRIVNPSFGFDANILNFYKNYSFEFDFTLSISDDDLFNENYIHPFDFIDLSIKSKKSAVVFNHMNFIANQNSFMQVSGKYYNHTSLNLGADNIANYFLRLLPRHVGILYSKKIIIDNLNIYSDFLETHHLYSVPLLMAATRGDLFFFDYPLFYFSIDNNNGGAWHDHASVFKGLLKYLISIRGKITDSKYAIAKDGFLLNYLGDAAWLRKSIESNGAILPSQEDILKIL